MTVALVGNQNCGKTTVFNALTGLDQHVGNFPGVTVEKKEGKVRGADGMRAVDLPGVYSLRAYSAEEAVTESYLLQEHPDVVLNILDGTALERGLYLTAQLLELEIPVVAAVNMMDEVRKHGMKIDFPALEEGLGIPVVPVCANSGEGMDRLIGALSAGSRKTSPAAPAYSGEAGAAAQKIRSRLSAEARKAGLPALFVAVRYLQGGYAALPGHLTFPVETETLIERAAAQMENKLGMDREAAVADMRYRFIDALCKRSCVFPAVRKGTFSQKIDRVLTGRFFAFPAFALIMLSVFWMTFGPPGSQASAWASRAVEILAQLVGEKLALWQAAPWLRSLIVEGLFPGVGSVLSFLPAVLILFFLLSLLEDTGYMARIAFVMDQPMRRFGLSGQSVVPLLMGFGCSVPAVLATRTLATERDRKITALLVPFMSCSAKLPIYTVFASAFFQSRKLGLLALLYLGGIFVGLLYALFFKSAVLRAQDPPFVLELPTYRFPVAANLLHSVKRRALDFLQKAFTVILLASAAVWFLQHFDFSLHFLQDGSASILAAIGRRLAPVFAPLGFGDWRAATALLTGLAAKESVISTLHVLTGGAGPSAIFTPASGGAFLAFTLLYMPCVAAASSIKRVLGGKGSVCLAMLAQFGIAWICAFCTYRALLLAGF